MSGSWRQTATIAERPVPPKGRLSFPMLMLRMIGNPVASWGEDFYDEPMVVYRWLGLETAFVMDPALIQTVLLDDADSYSKQPLNDDVFGEAIGGGLLNAEGEAWRWQRRLAAPLFRAEDVLAYVPAFAAACEPVLRRWSEAAPGALQHIDKDMTTRHLAGAARYGLGRQSRRNRKLSQAEISLPTRPRCAACRSLSRLHFQQATRRRGRPRRALRGRRACASLAGDRGGRSGRIFPRRCAYVGPAFGLRRGACARGFACARRPAEYGRCEGQARQALHASRLSVMGSRHRAGLLVMEASWATS